MPMLSDIHFSKSHGETVQAKVVEKKFLIGTFNLKISVSYQKYN